MPRRVAASRRDTAIRMTQAQAVPSIRRQVREAMDTNHAVVVVVCRRCPAVLDLITRYNYIE